MKKNSLFCFLKSVSLFSPKMKNLGIRQLFSKLNPYTEERKTRPHLFATCSANLLKFYMGCSFLWQIILKLLYIPFTKLFSDTFGVFQGKFVLFNYRYQVIFSLQISKLPFTKVYLKIQNKISRPNESRGRGGSIICLRRYEYRCELRTEKGINCINGSQVAKKLKKSIPLMLLP